MKILHLLYAGGTGGIEKLCKDIGLKSTQDENVFWFVHEGGNICEEMQHEKLEVIKTHYENRNIFPLYRQLKEEVTTRQIDIIVVHHPAPLLWLALHLYLMKKERAGVIVYAHNSYGEIIKRSRKKALIYNGLLRKCGHVIAISEYVKSTFSHVRGLSSDKISVVYNGVDVTTYRTERSKTHGGAVSLLYVGRLIPEKGVDKLLHAMALMKYKESVELTVVGDGSARTELEGIVKDTDLGKQVCFAGIQRNVADYLAAADVFVHPAVWEEGFGITVVEAMSAGLVCVTFSKGALPEIIQTGVNGFIVEECSEAALAKRLDWICEEIRQNNLVDVRCNAVTRAGDFTIEVLLQELNGIYRRIRLD